ncbi:MAG: glycosyltransferase family 2 protein [Treponema sp.]|nr:glycosyltransferase family 2 protein [Treponema sp.]
MDVSIIIVNYNTKDLIKNCIDSIYKHTKAVEFEIIVSDNGSTDGSIEIIKREFPNVILIENNENLGFGKANNRGLKIAKGKYIFYLNSDTVLLNNAVKYFFDYWETSPEKEEIGALGSNLLDVDGKVIHSYGKFLSINHEIYTTLKVLLNISKFTILKVLFNKPIPKCISTCIEEKKYIGTVDYITGADLFLKNSQDSEFDESFFMYCEETDLQYKISEKGLKRIIIEKPNIIHLCGASSSDKKEIDRIRYFTTFSSIQYYLSRLIYFKNRRENKIKIFFLKLLTKLIWLNPYIYKSVRKYL